MTKLALSNSSSKNALFLARCCQASYSKRPGATAAYKKNDLEKPVHFGKLPHSEFGDMGFVARAAKAIVVVIRGTDDLHDWLKNLDITKVAALGGQVHKGFLEGASSLYREVSSAIDNVDDAESNRLYLTGHSRGAAVGILLATRLLAEKQFQHPKQFSVYGFGCPRVGDIDFYDNYPLRDRTRLYINGGDPVAMAPLLTQEYVHVAEQLLVDGGRLRKIDLDSFVDSGVHLLRVDVKDHRIGRGYVKSLGSLV